MPSIVDDPRFKAFFQDVNFTDIKSITADTDLRSFIAGMLSYYPRWLETLFRIREILVSLLGLVRHDKPEDLPALSADAISFTPGGRVSFFIVRQAEEERFWVSESPADNHLAAFFGVVAHRLANGMNRFDVFTTIRYHNWTGPVYFNLIRPFHHLVVLKMMQAGAACREGEKNIMPSQTPADRRLIDRFSLTERMLLRTGWYGFMIVGVCGIYVQAPWWALAYLGMSFVAFVSVILPGLCAHCPYPSQYSTCLFLPPVLLNRFYPYKGPQMRASDKILVFAAMAAIVIMPQFWLIAELPLLALFWLLALPTLAAFPLRYCRRCRHRDCPMNRAGA